VKLDFENKTTQGAVNKSILYTLFHNNVYKNFDYFDQAKELFSRGSDHIRYVDVRLAFDASRANIPTIHVTLARDSELSQGIGGNLNAFGTIDYQDDTHLNTNARINNASFSIIITSDNTFEVALIYELIRAMLIMLTPVLSDQGLENLKIGGGDITINSNLIPAGIYVRTLDIQCEYPIIVPHPNIIDNQAFDIIRNWRASTTISTNEQDYSK
jgi:hypothetical protein